MSRSSQALCPGPECLLTQFIVVKGAANIHMPFLAMQKRIVEELLQQDGLTILANGLIWQKVFAVLLRLQIERRKDPTQRGVLLVLGCRDWQRTTLKDELACLDPSLTPRWPADVYNIPSPLRSLVKTMDLYCMLVKARCCWYRTLMAPQGRPGCGASCQWSSRGLWAGPPADHAPGCDK